MSRNTVGFIDWLEKSRPFSGPPKLKGYMPLSEEERKAIENYGKGIECIGNVCNNVSLQNLSFSNHYSETKDAIYVDGLTSSGTNNHGFGNSKKPTVVTNFTFGDKVYNFIVPAGEQKMFWGYRS